MLGRSCFHLRICRGTSLAFCRKQLCDLKSNRKRTLPPPRAVMYRCPENPPLAEKQRLVSTGRRPERARGQGWRAPGRLGTGLARAEPWVQASPFGCVQSRPVCTTYSKRGQMPSSQAWAGEQSAVEHRVQVRLEPSLKGPVHTHRKSFLQERNKVRRDSLFALWVLSYLWLATKVAQENEPAMWQRKGQLSAHDE